MRLSRTGAIGTIGALLTGATVLAGCATQAASGHAATPAPNRASTAALTPDSTPGSRTSGSLATAPPPTPPTAVPTTAVPVTAADGTNLGACLAGHCEVRVTVPATIPLRRAFKVGPVRVTAIQDGAVSMTIPISPTASQVSDDCTGDPSCVPDMTVQFGGDASSAQATVHPGGTFILNQLAVTVEAVTDGSAILRLATR
jgi:hypothetical protein